MKPRFKLSIVSFKNFIKKCVTIFSSREFAFLYSVLGTVGLISHCYYLISSVSSFDGVFKIVQAILLSLFISSSLLYFVAIADKDDEPKEYRRVMRAVNLFMVVEILINIYYYARHLIIDAPEMRIFDFVFGAVVSALIPVTIKLYANSIRAKQWLRELEGAGEVHQEAPEAPEAPDTQEDIPMFHVKHEAVVHAKHEAPQEATPVQEAEIIDPDPVPYPEFTFKVTTPFNPPPLETYPEDIVFHPVQEIPSPVLQDPAQIEALIEAKIESAYSDIIKKVKSEVEDICITFKQYTMDDALIKDQIKSEVLQYAENEIKATLDAELKTSPDLQTVDSFYHDTIEAKITEITEAHNKAFYRNIESLIEDAIKKYIQK